MQPNTRLSTYYKILQINRQNTSATSPEETIKQESL